MTTKTENKKPVKVPLWLIAVVSLVMAYVYAEPLGKDFFGGVLAGIGLAALSVDWALRQKAKAEAKKKKESEGFKSAEAAVSPVIGVILMVAITVILAAIVFVLVTQLSENQTANAPQIAFDANATVLRVIQAPLGLDWDDFAVTGCSTMPTGAVDAGDEITGCNAEVILTHKPSNSIIYSR